MWARERCRISPPRFLAECCTRQLNQGSFVLLYFRLFTFCDLYCVCLSVFSGTVLFVGISQVIGCEDRLRNDLYCVGWGVKLYSNQPTSASPIATDRRGNHARCVPVARSVHCATAPHTHTVRPRARVTSRRRVSAIVRRSVAAAAAAAAAALHVHTARARVGRSAGARAHTAVAILRRS